MKFFALGALLLWPATLIADDQPPVPVEVTVVDSSGAALPRAQVTLGRGGRTYTATFDGSGIYRVAVVPGDYSLRVSAEGFGPFSRSVHVGPRGPARFTASLQIHIAEHLEVRPSPIGSGPMLASGLILSGEALRDLPREPGELLRTLEDMAGTRGRPGDVAIYVNGFRNIHRLPPTEAIELIRINANPFSTEFAEPGSRRVEIVTKAGAQQSYGQLGLSWNGHALNARPALSLTPSTAETRNFTGAGGFPIVPERWGMTIYAGKWNEDDRAVVRATTLDRARQPQPFSQTVGTPNEIHNLTVQTAYRLGATTLSVEYARNGESADNQGLISGLDLPERAYTRSTREDAVRLSALSVLGQHAVHETRVQAVRRSVGSRAASDAPAVIVFDAFSAGGNQDALLLDDRDDRLELNDALTVGSTRHNLKMGLGVTATELAETNRANFGGTFTFGTDAERDATGGLALDGSGHPVLITPLENYRRTVLGVPGYRPTFFSIAMGNPNAAMTQVEYNWFVQDEWQPSDRVALSLGVRQDLQNNVARRRNFAPRVQLSFAGERTGTFRAGAGLFYATVPPGITLDTIRLDGRRQQWLLVQAPDFFPTVPASFTGATTTSPIVRTKASDLAMPHRIVSSLAYERQLTKAVQGSITYEWTRGVNLLRTRDVNAPVPDAPTVRPRADQGPILQFESTGTSVRHELIVSVLANVHRSFRLNANYTVGSTRTDTDGPYTAAPNPYDLAGEFGRAADDYRHQAYVGATIRIPFGLSVAPSIAARTGGAYNILAGTDGGRNGLFADRPAFASPGEPEAVVTPLGTFKLNPRPGDAVIPRNFGREPGQIRANFSVFKTFVLDRSGERRYLMVGVNGENVINRANLDNVMGIVTSPNFGQPNHALPARRVTLVLQAGF